MNNVNTLYTAMYNYIEMLNSRSELPNSWMVSTSFLLYVTDHNTPTYSLDGLPAYSLFLTPVNTGECTIPPVFTWGSKYWVLRSYRFILPNLQDLYADFLPTRR